MIRCRLSLPADEQVDPEAAAPDGAWPRALTDHAAAQRSPGANAADAADGAVGPADPLPCLAEPEPEHPRHPAASRRWREVVAEVVAVVAVVVAAVAGAEVVAEVVEVVEVVEGGGRGRRWWRRWWARLGDREVRVRDVEEDVADGFDLHASGCREQGPLGSLRPRCRRSGCSQRARAGTSDHRPWTSTPIFTFAVLVGGRSVLDAARSPARPDTCVQRNCFAPPRSCSAFFGKAVRSGCGGAGAVRRPPKCNIAAAAPV